MRHFVRKVTIGTSPLDALESVYKTPRDATRKFTAWLMHGTNLYALPTRCHHILPIFFFLKLEYFILRGIFFQNRGKNILFGEESGAEFRPQKQQKKNTAYRWYKTSYGCSKYSMQQFKLSGDLSNIPNNHILHMRRLDYISVRFRLHFYCVPGTQGINKSWVPSKFYWVPESFPTYFFAMLTQRG